jgi:hypothetical protein
LNSTWELSSLGISQHAKMVAYDKDAVVMSAVGGAVLGASTAALMGLTGMRCSVREFVRRNLSMPALPLLYTESR